MLPVHCHHRVHIASQADLVTARAVMTELIADADLDEEDLGRVRIIVAELATNLLRHAGGGVLLLRRQLAADASGRALVGANGVECLALDRGPGIADLEVALAGRRNLNAFPGQGQGQGLGHGLGAVRRLSDRFDIHSEPGLGTAVMAQVQGRGSQALPMSLVTFPFGVGATMLPMTGCSACGDGWAARPDGLVLVVDGLGHGDAASAAARCVESVFSTVPADQDLQAILAAIHSALRGTRGAAVMVLRLGATTVEVSAIGNIAGKVLSRAGAIPLGSRWGIVGYNAAPPPSACVPWHPGDLVILHSDGCVRLTDLVDERHLRHVDPTLAAAVLLRDCTVRVDDQTIMVLANRRPA
ncbi:ATP-binding protein [Paracraurococcus lichenis]|uniref:ATP-binding protein n=1 Tax=Paracraurococcus lichenis TaxID=3064888 RepID=A0ABT9E9S9_9PROT|nr:ATP-binding protein [Paracraurococcus sp. LOR1-02]MDO9712956.1 ATP-binding protein [Paracraurococcus sp. LOR1-02]